MEAKAYYLRKHCAYSNTRMVFAFFLYLKTGLIFKGIIQSRSIYVDKTELSVSSQ
jgi:hypothetical protein